MSDKITHIKPKTKKQETIDIIKKLVRDDLGKLLKTMKERK